MKILLGVLFSIVLFGQIACDRKGSFNQVAGNDKRMVQKVDLYFSGKGYPCTAFTVDFNSDTLVCTNYGNEPVLNKSTKQLIPVFEKAYKLSSVSSRKLRELFSTYIPDTSVVRYEDVMDGHGFDIRYIRSQKDTVWLHVGNPIHTEKYKTDFLQLKGFFKVAYSIVKDPQTINFIDETYEVYLTNQD